MGYGGNLLKGASCFWFAACAPLYFSLVAHNFRFFSSLLPSTFWQPIRPSKEIAFERA